MRIADASFLSPAPIPMPGKAMTTRRASEATHLAPAQAPKAVLQDVAKKTVNTIDNALTGLPSIHEKLELGALSERGKLLDRLAESTRAKTANRR